MEPKVLLQKDERLRLVGGMGRDTNLRTLLPVLVLTTFVLLGCSTTPDVPAEPAATATPDIEARVEAFVEKVVEKRLAAVLTPTASAVEVVVVEAVKEDVTSTSTRPSNTTTTTEPPPQPTAAPTPVPPVPTLTPVIHGTSVAVEVDQQESRTEEQNETFWNEPRWPVTQKCNGNFQFTHKLVEPKVIMQIMFGPGSHVWPHEHMTYWAVADDAGIVQLYAPTDIYRIDVGTGSLSDLERDPYTEWGGMLYLCDGHALGLGHVAEPSDEILAILADAERDCDVGCRWNTETFIPAGTPIFKSSHYIKAIDIGLQMVGLTAEQLQELPGYGYSITPWRAPGGNAVCSLEYFPEPIRSDYLDLLHSSTCGPFNQDVPGTAMGYWMPSPSPGIFPSLPSERDIPAEEEIIWLHQAVTESAMHTISVGSTTFGLDFGHYVYTTSSSGLVNSRWDFVKPGHTYCTELQKKINQYKWEQEVKKILLTRLSQDGASLTVEATSGDKCGDGPWVFHGGERTFYR